MAATPKLRIPPSEAEPLGVLRDLSEEQFVALLAATRAAEPRLDINDLAEQVQNRFEAQPDISDVIGMSVRATRAFHAGHLQQAIVDELVRLGTEKSPANGEATGILRSRILRMAEIDSIRITAAANLHLTAQPNAFIDCSVNSDIRPIFIPERATADARASVIVHQLQLELFRNGGQPETLYVSLDDADLISLRDVVDTAIKRIPGLQASESEAGRVVVRP